MVLKAMFSNKLSQRIMFFHFMLDLFYKFTNVGRRIIYVLKIDIFLKSENDRKCQTGGRKS